MRRITAVLVLLSALALALAGCDGDSDVPVPPRPPEGMRYVGVGRAVVAVPEDWPVVTAQCGAPDADHVYPLVQEYVAARCLPAGRHVDVTLGIGPLAPGSEDGLAFGLRDGGQVDGVDVRQSDSICQGTDRTELCGVTFTVPSEQALFRVSARAGAHPSVDEVRDSLRLLPDDWTTVPVLLFGTSEDDAAAALEQAGLEPVRPDVDWPHYVTSTDPEAGSVVRVGSEVELVPGDG